MAKESFSKAQGYVFGKIFAMFAGLSSILLLPHTIKTIKSAALILGIESNGSFMRGRALGDIIGAVAFEVALVCLAIAI